MWYRIFCRSPDPSPPSKLLEHLQVSGFAVEGHFKGDDLGWTAAELKVGIGSPIYAERYLTKEDSLRDDLNSWAAFLETCDYSPNSTMLMERVIQSQQMITLRKPIDHSNDIVIDNVCVAVAQFIAERADGIYQIDEDGWYAPNGEMLLKEY